MWYNVFKIMIPLTAVSVRKVGPSHSNLVTDQVSSSENLLISANVLAAVSLISSMCGKVKVGRSQ